MTIRPPAQVFRPLRSLIALSLTAGALALPPAHAVHLSPDDTGQVILVPYYSVRNGFVTSLTVVNRNMEHSKVVKVRFREGMIGAAVLDLNLFLAPRDVWSASIADDGSGARLTTVDRSCTNPEVPGSGTAFSNRYYTGQVAGTFDDGGGASLDRTREGYVEIIEMGVIADGSDAMTTPPTATGSMVSAAITSRSTGVPADCGAVQTSNLFAGQGDLRAPAGGLSTSAILIQSNTGSEFVIPPTALQRFFVSDNPADDLYAEPGSTMPDLTSVRPARSDVWTSNRDEPSVVTVNDWVAAGGQPIDAVSAVLIKSDLAAEYDVSGGQIRSEMVFTMPTMRYYVMPEGSAPSTFFVARSPFSEAFKSPTNGQTQNDSRACNTIQPLASDRATAPYATLTGVQFPTPPSGIPDGRAAICRATSRLVIVPNGSTYTAQSVLGSDPTITAIVLPANGLLGAAPQYSAGWLALLPTTKSAAAAAPGPGQFAENGANAVSTRPVLVRSLLGTGGLANIAPLHSDGKTRRYRGLPIIGFTAIQAVVAGQGYGGGFKLQGGADPAP